MSAALKDSASSCPNKPTVALVGGDGRRRLHHNDCRISTFPSARDGGNGDVKRLLAAVAGGTIDVVILMTRWLGHSTSHAVTAACKRHDVALRFCTGGMSAARRMIDAELGVPAEPARPGVVLVDLYWTRDKDPRVPLGHASLLASLRDAGIPTTPIVRAVNSDAVLPEILAVEIVSAALALGANSIVALGAYVWAEHVIQPLLPALRAAGFGGTIVLGGPQISYSGAGVDATYPDADVFVRGYGEQALIALAKDPGAAIDGVHRRGESDGCAQARVELGKLPSPFSTDLIPLEGQKFVRWETQRGCPYLCSFCQHREAGARLEWRDLDVDRLLAEIELFVAHGVEKIAVLDPIFNVGDNALPVLRAFIQRGFRGELSLQCRPEKLTDEFLSLAAQLDVCLEFGLQTIHAAESKAVKRANVITKVDAALARVRELGLRHEVSLIFGLPEQTLNSFKETVRWCLEREVPVIKAFPLLLLRGTELDRDRDRWGLQTLDGPMGMVMASNSFTDDEWFEMACISEALKATEGCHPSFDELERLARTLRPNVARWVAEES